MYQHTSVFDVEVTLKCYGWKTRLFPGKRLSAPRRVLVWGYEDCRPFQMLCENIDSRFDQQEKKLDEIRKMTRGTSHLLPSVEQDARQPRLAMEADGPANTKTRERTEGDAAAVQAIRGDRCSADRVDPDPTCSTSSGDDCTGPPAPPCSRENVLRCPNRISHPWRCAHHQPPVAYFPPAKPQRQRRSPSTSHLFGSARPRRRIQRRQMYGLQFHPPGTTTVSGEINCLLPPPAGGLWRQNRYKIGRSIQAVYQGRLRAYPFLGTWCALLCGEGFACGSGW